MYMYMLLFNRAAVGVRGLCSAFGLFFSFVGDQMQTSARPSLASWTLIPENCNIHSPKAFET